ncbi:hypothetical protein PV11_00357 [Exophiala sideris]|uniref:Amidase domain-containing protein n=1 Tax=Exophiala sideris TaxID=1016849 RepID=A0A0D1YT11_9EURO|nr:hypothetical protein PV11_00357 [Exophiala sideris]
MSVVSLTEGGKSSITSDLLRRIATAYNINFTSPDDEATYLLLLRSLESTFQAVSELPTYVSPQLAPQATHGGHRSYWKPPEESNPLNAWSHQCHLVSAEPSSSILATKTVAVKDNVSIAGLPTTLGTFPQLISQNSSYPVATIDATTISRLLKSGAIIKGTTTCETYGSGPLSYSAASGPVDNPWAAGYTCGGSSSGAAALVALSNARQASSTDFCEGVDIAIGTDQGGSVRIPAAYTGIYGFKPTFGLVPYTGIASGAPMVDHCGILARNLSDIAAVLEVVAGYDGLDPRMSPEAPLTDNVKNYTHILNEFMRRSHAISKSKTRLRIALIKESFRAPGLSREVAQVIKNTAHEGYSRAGATVSEISIPMHSLGSSIWTAATRLAVVESGIRGRPSDLSPQPLPHLRNRWPPDQEMYDLLTATNPGIMNLIFQGAYVDSTYSATTLSRVQGHCLELRAAYDKALEEHDILITPAAPTVAMKHPKVGAGFGGSVMEKIKLAVGSTNNTCPFNISGHPALTVPCGLGSVEGEPGTRLPVGIQLIGRRFEDDVVLNAASLLASF